MSKHLVFLDGYIFECDCESTGMCWKCRAKLEEFQINEEKADLVRRREYYPFLEP